MEEPEWEHCFICSTLAAKCKGGSCTEPFNLSSHGALLRYLLGGTSWGIDGQTIYQGIVKLASSSSTVSSSTSMKPEVLIRFCVDCDKMAEQIVELQKELDAIQKKIAGKVKVMRNRVVYNSRLYGSNVETRESIQKLEDDLTQKEKQGDERWREKRQFLEVLHRFQTVVVGKDNINIPTVLPEEPCKEDTSGGVNLYVGGNSWKAKPQVPQNYLLIKRKPEVAKVRDSKCSDINKQLKIKIEEEVEVEGMEDDSQSSSDEEEEASLSPSISTPVPPRPPPVPAPRTQQVIIVMKAEDGTSSTVQKCVEMEVGGEQDSNYEKQFLEKTKTRQKLYYCLSVKKPVNCKLCSFTSRLECQVEQHFQEHETDKIKERKCPYCEKMFTQKQTWERHKNHHTRNRKCDACEQYVPVFEMEKHLRKHGDRIFRCEYCPFVFGTYPGLISHMYLGNQGRMLKCQLCLADNSLSFPLKANLIKHLYDSHGYTELGIKCDVPECSRIFFSMGQKQRHMNIHERKFPCPICDKLCESDGQRNSHIRLAHHKERPFKCDLCEETYANRTSLNHHKSAKHGEDGLKFKCDLCPGKEYKSRYQLQTHKNGCHREKRFKCPQCDHETIHRSQLREHMKRHTDQRDFKCNVCGFATRSNQLLQNHMLQHGGEKKFLCSYCSKAFLVRKSLQCHERIHTGEKPYKCDLCGVAYSQRGQLRIHIGNKHPPDGQPQPPVTKVTRRSQKSKM